MKTKSSTKIMALMAGSFLTVGTMQAQQTKAQSDSLLRLQRNAISGITGGQEGSAKPGQSGFWGYAFGDYAYIAKGDSAGRGTKQQYKGMSEQGTAPHENAMEIRRAYLGYDYYINQKFSAYALLAYEGDQDVNDDRTVYLKYFYAKWKNIWKGTDFKLGQQATNSFATAYQTEPLMEYRSVEKTIMDMHGMDGSSDMGAMLEGRIWTAKAMDSTKVPLFIGYSAMIGDNSGNNPVAGFTAQTAGASLSGQTVSSGSITVNNQNATTDVAKKFRVNVYVNCLNNALTIGLYGDYINYGNQGFHPYLDGDGGKNISGTVMDQAVTTMKVYAAYNSRWFGVGGELVMQSMSNGEVESYAIQYDTNESTKKVTSTALGTNDTTTAKQIGYSLYAHGTIIPNCLNIFARYDSYTADNDYSYSGPTPTPGAHESVSSKTLISYTSYMSNVSNSANGNSYKETFITAGLDWTPTKDKKYHLMPNIWYYGIKNAYGSDNLASDNYMVYRITFLFAFN